MKPKSLGENVLNFLMPCYNFLYNKSSGTAKQFKSRSKSATLAKFMSTS